MSFFLGKNILSNIGGLSMPNIVETAIFPITNRCNLRCNFCFASAQYSNKDKMDLSYFENKINELKDYGLKKVILTGGEPTIHPDFYKFLKVTTNFSLPVQVLTNGTTTLDKEIYQNEYISHFVVSIDGESETHDFLRGKKGAYERTVKFLEHLPKKIPFSTTMTVSEKNISEIEAVYLLSISLGAQSITINPVIPDGKAAHIEQGIEVHEKIFEEIKRVYQKYFFKIPIYTSLCTREKLKHYLNPIVTNLFRTLWIGNNDIYSHFPLPSEENDIYSLGLLDSKIKESTFYRFLLMNNEMNNIDNPNGVIDQHQMLKDQYKRYILGVNNV